MSITATNLFSAASAAVNGSSNAPAAPPPQPTANAPSASGGADTVQLTVAQRVYQLYNQGQQISQIASALSLSVDSVNSYLNITNTAANTGT